jgi:hypothetical protein
VAHDHTAGDTWSGVARVQPQVESNGDGHGDGHGDGQPPADGIVPTLTPPATQQRPHALQSLLSSLGAQPSSSLPRPGAAGGPQLVTAEPPVDRDGPLGHRRTMDGLQVSGGIVMDGELDFAAPLHPLAYCNAFKFTSQHATFP